jgi:hypothetical protein
VRAGLAVAVMGFVGGYAAPVAGQAAPSVRVEVLPVEVRVERRAHSQNLAFDLIVENASIDTLRVSRVELQVFDRGDAMVLRRFLDGNGTRPNLEALGERTILPNSTRLFFNPFPTFDPDVELGRLVVTLEFESIRGVQHGEHPVEIRPVDQPTATALRLPFRGRALVYDGHDALAHHRRFDYRIPGLRAFGFESNFMRYAYDFCPVDDEGRMVIGDPEKNESWLGFGDHVLAAGAGTVVAAEDGMADDRRFDEAMIPTRPMVLFGNHVVIDHGNGEFSLFAHLQRGSVAVKKGSRVQPGQFVGRIGASGSANIPHLHYELRNGVGIQTEGLPSTFTDYRRVLGRKIVDVKSGAIDTGEIVEGK